MPNGLHVVVPKAALLSVPNGSPPRDDLALIEGIQRGESAAMSVLYDRHAAAMLGLALRITRESADAEDVVVDAFAQAWRDAIRFDAARGSVLAWLATITRTRALDLVRARVRRERRDDAANREPDAPAMGTAAPSPAHVVLTTEKCLRVRAALAELPEPQRRALELAYFEGLSQSEIAQRLDEPLGTVKTRVRLGLRRMREALQPLAPENSQ